MARKYNLCFVDNNTLVPIDLSKCFSDFEGYFKFEGDILELLDFTTSFKSEESLLKYLNKKMLIPSEDVRLEYSIQEPVKDENGKVIAYVEKLFSSYAKNLYVGRHEKCFDIDVLKQYFYNNFYNVEFYNNFYRYCLSNFRFKDVIDNYIVNNMKLENLNDFMGKLKERINHPYLKKLVNNVPESKYNEFSTIIKNELLRTVARDPYFRIEMAKKFGNEITVNNSILGNVPIFVSLNGFYSVIQKLNENDELGVSSPKELYDDYDKFIEEIWNELMINSKGNIKTRAIVDWGMFVAHYESYLDSVGKDRQITKSKEDMIDDDYYDDEEEDLELSPAEIKTMSEPVLIFEKNYSDNDEEFLTVEDFGNDEVLAASSGYLKK